MPNPVVQDASELFNNYMTHTRGVVRSVKNLVGPNYTYPPYETEQDLMVFATIYTCVWEAIKEDFPRYYNDPAKAPAFKELEHVVEANNDFPFKGIWIQDGDALQHGNPLRPLAVDNMDGMLALCRTLRNGFNHFNYRWVNEPPDVYFGKLNIPTPHVIQQPQHRQNYRTFLCDWSTSRRNPRQFLDRDSNSRVLETSCGIFRQHLHEFLGLFFHAECGRAHTRIWSLY